MSKRKTERLLGLVVCPALYQALSHRRADPRRRARLPRAGRSVQADVRAGQGGPARPRRAVGDRRQSIRSTRIPATGSGRTPDELPELRLEADEAAVSSAWPRGSGGGPSWPAPPPGRCSSSAPPASTPTREAWTKRRALAGPPGHRAPAGHARARPSGRCGRRSRDRRPVTFSYRAAGPERPAAARARALGVVNRHGRWYVAGWGPGPQRHPGVPAGPDRGPGEVLRAAGGVTFPGHRRARATSATGTPRPPRSTPP